MIRSFFIVALCASPSAAFSIGPQLAALWRGSAGLDAGVVEFLILQTAATLIVVLASHAAGTAESWLKLIAGLGLASLIACVQFGAALEVASHKRDLGAGLGVRSAAAVQRDLTAARNSRDELPPDKRTPVTEEMIDAAKKAEADECKDGVGGNCRKRQDDVKDYAARRPIFARIEALEVEIKTAPRHVDGMAYRVSLILQKLGVDADEASVTDWWPAFQAFMVEMIAAVGPYALSRRHDKPVRPARMGWWQFSRRREILPTVQKVEIVAEQPIAEPVATPASGTAGVGKTGVAPKSRNSRKTKPSKAAAVTPVRDWYDSRTTVRPGYDQPCGEAHDDYKAFAIERGEAPLNLTAFGNAMRDEIGVEKITTPSKRNFYRGIALKGRMKLVASN